MSLKLEQDSTPGLLVKNSLYDESKLFFILSQKGELPVRFSIGPKDMAELVKYWMTNTDLTPNDPRMELLTALAYRTAPVAGNPGQQRLRIE